MALKKFFLPRADAVLITWLLNFIMKFKIYASSLGYITQEITAIENDVLAIIHSVQIAEFMRAKVRDFTNYKNNLIKGNSTGFVVNPPDPGTLPVLANPVEPGSMKRILNEIKRIKTHKNYTTDMGKDMVIIGTEHIIDYDEITTIVTIKSNLPNGIKCKYIKNGMTGADVYCLTIKQGTDINDSDLNNAKFEKIMTITGNVFEDKRLNQSRQPEIRIYKILLKKGDIVVGKPSNYLRVVAEVYVDSQGSELSIIPQKA